jgi:hypothetical protein
LGPGGTPHEYGTGPVYLIVAQLQQAVRCSLQWLDPNDILIGVGQCSLVTAGPFNRRVRLHRDPGPDVAAVLINGTKGTLGARAGNLQLIAPIRYEIGTAVQERRKNATGFGASFEVDATGPVDEDSNKMRGHLHIPKLHPGGRQCRRGQLSDSFS